MTVPQFAIDTVKSCPFILGQHVRVKQRGGWTADWPDIYTIVGLFWKSNTINVWLYDSITVSDDFVVDDLEKIQ